MSGRGEERLRSRAAPRRGCGGARLGRDLQELRRHPPRKRKYTAYRMLPSRLRPLACGSCGCITTASPAASSSAFASPPSSGKAGDRRVPLEVREPVRLPEPRADRLQVYDLARREERFDLVLFRGVLYHLRHPLLALDLLADKAERLLLVLQTLTTPGDEGIPTNWWAPNAACVEVMLRSCGLETIARPGNQMWVCRPRGLPAAVRAELDAAARLG